MCDYNELYQALLTIKSACENYYDTDVRYECGNCPMSQGDTCCVTDVIPVNWELVKPTCKIMK